MAAGSAAQTLNTSGAGINGNINVYGSVEFTSATIDLGSVGSPDVALERVLIDESTGATGSGTVGINCTGQLKATKVWGAVAN